ncbi:MAG: Sterol-4-alpha-carboxylate 3-dehydrogenase (decarboxylating) [Bryobacterales bacterium]|nr:Sterol-4-alpha-carboxylate 3-dehydrogenase (decarboxylating) [Bryobacterales bacterium]
MRVLTTRLSDTGALAQAVQDVSVIYHCAARSTDWAPWRSYYESNVMGVQNLLEAAAKAPTLRRFVHVSTTDVYGYPLVPCSESEPTRDVGLPYNRTKILGDELVRRSNLPFTIIRPATIYGPRGKDFATTIATHLRQGTMAVIDGGRAPGGFCYVDNVVDAMIAAAHSGAALGQAYNLSDGTQVNWRIYVDGIARGIGTRRAWIDIPATLAFPLARAFEILPGRPMLTRHAVYLLSRNQEYPAAKAQRDFGYTPRVSINEGMARTIEWLNASRTWR